MATQKEVLIDPIFNNNPIALQVLHLFCLGGNHQHGHYAGNVSGGYFRHDDVKSLGITVA